jgi:diphthine-ammonia ligase
MPSFNERGHPEGFAGLKKMQKNALLMWSGGKDSFLALHRVLDSGLSVTKLATFVPLDNESKKFKAHPKDLIVKQAEAIRYPHIFVRVSEPFKEGYVSALLSFKEEFGIDTIITGDIDFVAGFPNWISECCKGIKGIEVVQPLWQNSRSELLREVLERGIEARVSWLNHPAIPLSWKDLLLDDNLVRELENLSLEINGFDACGENGEYHTVVVYDPALFRKHERINIADQGKE